MFISMKINFDIDISDEKIPQSIAKKKRRGDCLYASFSMLSHFCLLALLFCPTLFAENIIVDEGDNSIKAIMVDLSLAAPKQSLIENTPDIQGIQDSDIIDNKPIEETPIIEHEIEVEKSEPISEKRPDKPTVITEKDIIVKQKDKVKKKHRPMQKASRQQVRQEVITENISNTSVAPQISDSRQYSGNPSPISRNQPEYPRRALDMRLEGYVIVLFDINSNGRIENIRIIETKPNNIFNRSVISAMKMWKYQPIAAKDQKIKIIFNRDKSISLD